MNLTEIKISSHPNQRPAMSGHLRKSLDEGEAVGLFITPENQAAFQREIPVDEWNVTIERRAWGTHPLTLLLPHELGDTAFIRPYWPTPLRPRQQLARYDWQNTEPSPNPGLLA